MEILKIPVLRSPVMVIAFAGWNDAGEAASGAASHLLGCWTDPEFDVVPELIAEVDPEEFYDFQVNRPTVYVDDSSIRNLTWPGTQVFALATPSLDHDFIVVRGVEPSMKWKTFASDLLDLADDCEVDLVITLGSMLADTPHTRPITVSGSGAHPDIAKRLGVEISKYEGPTGILGVIQDACIRRGIDAISLWAAIPHYASNSPSPKASLALVNALEDFLEVSIPQGELPDDALEWEEEVTELAKEDTDVAEYVKALEESKDAVDLPEATGESIARELERFLRRQTDK
jgi:proteasome assembly chaperone (PAC2) family protein|uniref:PAC2 family protein n=1 Tax=Candidatus Planktophila sp. TaxID=2175601 RepID=UPI004049B3F1